MSVVTFGELREIQKGLEPELEPLASQWQGISLGVVHETNEVFIRLTRQHPSRVIRLLYRVGVLRLPKTPARIGGYRVVTEVRDIILL